MNNPIEPSKRGVFAGLTHGFNASRKPADGESDKNLEGWKRAMADYDNLHRRVAEEKKKAWEEGAESALKPLIMVLDYFDAAFSSVPKELENDNWVNGVKQIQKAFHDALETMGVKKIESKDVPFDPLKHEAVSEVVKENGKQGFVDSIISCGYELNGKIIRPARVLVVKNNIKFSAPASEESGEEKE